MPEKSEGVEPDPATAIDSEQIINMLHDLEPEQRLARLLAMSDEDLHMLLATVGRERLITLVRTEPVGFGDSFKEEFRKEFTGKLLGETTLVLSLTVVRTAADAATYLVESVLGRSLRVEDQQIGVAGRIAGVAKGVALSCMSVITAREIQRRIEAGERMFAPRERKLNTREEISLATQIALSGYEVASGKRYAFSTTKRRRLTGFGRAEAVCRVAHRGVVLSERLRSHLYSK